MPDPHQRAGDFFAFVGGLHATPALISHPGYGRGIGVEIPLRAARALFGVPPGVLGNVVVDLGDLVGAATARELTDRLNVTETWPARFAVLDDVLGRLVARGTERRARPEVAAAWDGIVTSRGRVAISGLAAEVGWSRRHLLARFTAEIGLTPKMAARVVRFERACSMLLATTPPPPLSQVAVACGYYDQSHLNRDWAELAGCTPTAWLAEELHDPVAEDLLELPFVQDGAGVMPVASLS